MVSIPKIIMQTWKNHDIPDGWKCSPESIKKHMPDWKYVLQTDEDNRNLIRDHYPQYLKRYDGFRYNIQRVDFARYAWLHKHGGIYMDLDFEVQEPLDRFFIGGSLFFLPMHDNRSTGCNSFMASKAGHLFWIKLMDHINETENLTHFFSFTRVLNESGPSAVKRVLERESFAWTVLPREMRPGNPGDPNVTEGALRSLPGGSWFNIPQFIVEMLPNVSEYYTCIFCCFVVVVTLIAFFLMARCRNIIILK